MPACPYDKSRNKMINFEPWWNDTEGGIRSTRRKACLIATFSSIILKWTDRRSNPALNGRLKCTKYVRNQFVRHRKRSVLALERNQSQDTVKRNNGFLEANVHGNICIIVE